MKILMIGLNMVERGTYWRIFHLSRHLSKLGHSITIMATSRNNHFKMSQHIVDGISLVETPDLFEGALRSGWDPWNTVCRIAWLTSQNYDLVHAFESRPTVIYPALNYSRQRKIPLVIDWADWFGRGGSVEERQNKIIRNILRPFETYFELHYRNQATGTTVICSTLRDKALDLKIDPATILLLPNGSDTDNIRVQPKEIARQRLGIPREDFIIGYIGSIFFRDTELMMNAFELTRSSIPNARLLLIGKSIDNHNLHRDQVNRLTLTGYIADDRYNDYLSACDIFWLPLKDTNANRGRLPLKLNDYMAAGRPTVATAVGDIPKYIKNGQNGCLCAPTPADIADKTVALFQNPELRLEMGKQARWQAENIYNWHLLAAELDNFYTKII